ncbi:MAG: hypothetical protein B7X03_03645 [Parcubacteria group bacterium 21-58-10]|nr:MAG: hypothetical protein B7X03_03645 [Parcubacteria group bacterium 21-58-10]
MAIKPKAACTDEELIELLKKHVTVRKVADVLGVHHSSITRRKAVLVKRGFSPPHHMMHTVPQGYAVKGISSYFDRDGNLAGQWVKSREDAEQQEALMRAFVAALGEDVRGHAAPVPRPQKRWAPGSTSAYLIGDAHFGLYAWGAETGNDFNTDIADQDLRAAIDRGVARRPPGHA